MKGTIKPWSVEQKIEHMRRWCEMNYENGADTMVECWETSEYEELINESDGDLYQAMMVLKSIAGVYEDRQADARYHIESGR